MSYEMPATNEELKQLAIDKYVDLLRIKHYEQGENRELDYQIKIIENKLHEFGVNTENYQY